MFADCPTIIDRVHQGAILDAEARRLGRTLMSYGVLSRRQLAKLSGAGHWSQGRFIGALERAEERGLIRPLGFDFYAPGPPSADVREGGRRYLSHQH
jgi:hypothetical protein